MLEKMKFKVDVFDVPECIKKQPYPYIVCNAVDGALWYYGAYRTLERASEVAKAMGAIVVERIEQNGC